LFRVFSASSAWKNPAMMRLRFSIPNRLWIHRVHPLSGLLSHCVTLRNTLNVFFQKDI